MSRTTRLRLFLVAAAVLAAGLITAAGRLPGFGGLRHPYGERAVAAGLERRTANIVSSVNFDQRAFDTLGEESILFGSVLGAGMLLRLARDEHKRGAAAEPVLPTTRLFGATLLPVTVLTGGYLVAHGALSPGGGFQGGVALATALHLAYVAADYRVLKRIRPLAALDVADALAAGAFAALGLVGLAAGAGYLANTLPLGTFNQLASSGLVAVVNAAVGVEVASGVVVLLAHFLDQAVEVAPAGGAGE
ncbi:MULTISPECIES: MnhB domain-containing protein [unclassified Kitasatospora]|uniref:MnhB domain-containing protein n=1 Tax=unclassified Kitasatospora TaxID=2633591 RepID=UPI0033EBF6B2